MLCYHEGEVALQSARKAISLFEKAGLDFELIIVANYKDVNDPTPALVAEFAKTDPRVRYSTVFKQGMFGWDMRTGFALATGNYVAVIDGDGQMPFEDIVRVYEAARASNADMGKTYRTKRHDGKWRIFISRIYNVLFHLLFPGLKARDMNSKPKVFPRRSFEKLHLVSDDWFIDAEMMIQTRRHHFTIVEVPTVFYKLEGRRSLVRLRTIVEFLRNFVIFRTHEFFV